MMKLTQSCVIVYLTVISKMVSCFYVTIENITTCDDSELELGELKGHISNRHPLDQTFNGKFILPVDIGMDAVLEYKSKIWDKDDEEWKALFTGERSVCRSLVKSVPYQMLAKKTNFPYSCPIREGTYELNAYPVSGEYFVFNTIRGVPAHVKHTLRLIEDGILILCRHVYTRSHEK